MNLRQNPFIPTAKMWYPGETEVTNCPDQGTRKCGTDVIPPTIFLNMRSHEAHCFHSHNTIRERVEEREEFWKHNHLPRSCLSHLPLIKRNSNVSSPVLLFYRWGNKRPDWQTHLLEIIQIRTEKRHNSIFSNTCLNTYTLSLHFHPAFLFIINIS